MTRGSPKRNAETRCPAITVGCCRRSNGVLGEHTVVTDVLDFEELAIDLLAEVAKMREIVEPFPDPEVPRVIDRDLGA